MQKTGFVYALMAIVLFACSGDSVKEADISEIKTEVSLRRFDLDFFGMKQDQLPGDLAKLKTEYPNFFPFYQNEIMAWDSSEVLENCMLLLSDTNVAKLQDTIKRVFGDFSEQMEILSPAFKRFRYFFPEAPLPEIIIAYTEFLFRTGTDSNMLILPLEMYMGENYPVYTYFDIPAYMLRRMNKYHLPPLAMSAWLDQTFGSIPAGNRFLDQMIKEGKQLYFLESVLPNTADSLLTGWTTENLKWLKENEFQMWTFYISEKYLYSTDGAYYMPLLTDGPFTAAPNIPPGSAPKIGAYTGWQIVKRYMKENPERTMQALFEELDSDKILRESGYRP
ncbi:MAG: hypothetical protein GC180_04335 [Bacteroidetes bacterium]|nr:hypothetical protein [Bacteroidota bacterium]